MSSETMQRNVGVVAMPDPNGAAQPCNLYIVAIGVGQYPQDSLQLRYPAKDARDFVATLKAQEGRLFQSVTSRVLCDQEARRRHVLEAVDWLRQKATEQDMAMLFLAGHGCNHLETGNYYYLPWDVEPESLVSTAVAGYELREQIAHIRSKRLIFMDTCRAGNVFADGHVLRLRGEFGTDARPFINELQRANNAVVVFASSTGQQPSAESDRWGNGAFTKALVEGLRGRACDGNRDAVTLNMLACYVGRRVPELTQSLQTPTTAILDTVADFPLAIGPFHPEPETKTESATPGPARPLPEPADANGSEPDFDDLHPMLSEFKRFPWIAKALERGGSPLACALVAVLLAAVACLLSYFAGADCIRYQIGLDATRSRWLQAGYAGVSNGPFYLVGVPFFVFFAVRYLKKIESALATMVENGRLGVANADGSFDAGGHPLRHIARTNRRVSGAAAALGLGIACIMVAIEIHSADRPMFGYVQSLHVQNLRLKRVVADGREKEDTLSGGGPRYIAKDVCNSANRPSQACTVRIMEVEGGSDTASKKLFFPFFLAFAMGVEVLFVFWSVILVFKLLVVLDVVYEGLAKGEGRTHGRPGDDIYLSLRWWLAGVLGRLMRRQEPRRPNLLIKLKFTAADRRFGLGVLDWV